MKIPRISKAVPLLLAFLIPLGFTLPTTASAATEPTTEGASVFIGTTDGTQAQIATHRLGYSLSEGIEGSPAVDLTPIDGKYSFVTGGFVPAYLEQSETNVRTITFTNTSDAAFTVEDIAAEIVESDFEGGASTHQLIGAGTSVLAAPQADVTVPAGSTIPVTFETVDPYAAILRTNSAGEISGVGATTDFTFTVNGNGYGFQEVIGIGSASANTFTDSATSEMALFPTCDFEDSGEQQLTLCATLAGASVSMTSLFFDDQPIVVPNDITLEDEQGNPVDGSDPLVTAPAAPEPSGDGTNSKSSGGWFANLSSLCTNAAPALTLGLAIGVIIIIIVTFLILTFWEVQSLRKREEFLAFDVNNTMTTDQMAKYINPTGSDRIEEKVTTPPFPTLTKKEEN